VKGLIRARSALCLIAGLILAACSGSPPAPKPSPHAEGHGNPGYRVGAPYQIDGIWYYPAEDWSYDETGIASWYGEQFHGRYTADGEIFDLNAMTAAHRTLPLPSVVQVTNLDNGRSVNLRVNDRGPFAHSRIIDVSRRAAQLLGFETSGTAKVRVRILVPETLQAAAIAKHQGGQDGAPALAGMRRETVSAQALPAPSGTKIALNKPVADPPKRSGSFIIGSALAAEPALSEHAIAAPMKPAQIYIQAGAFTQADNARRLQGRLQAMGPAASVVGIAVNGVSVYRVRVGPLATVEEADQLLDRIVGGGIPEARIIID
jgi:rare lipoprotein A